MTCDDFVEALSRTQRPDQELRSHARDCNQCQPLWQAHQTLRSVVRPATAPGMSDELQQTLAAHRGTTRVASASKRMFAVLAASLACSALALAWLPRGDLRATAIAPFLIVFIVLTSAVAAYAQLLLYRDRAGFGAPAWARASFVVLGGAGFEWLAVWYSRSSLASGAALHLSPARDCALLGSLVALAVGLVTFIAARGTVLLSPRSSGALAGCIAGLAAALFLHVHCPASAALHLQVVHAFPLVLAVILGALAGRRWLAA